MASVSQEYQGYTQGGGSGKVKVTILASEWGSSKGGLSTINRKLAIQLAKSSEVEITFFVPQCSKGDKKEALSHKINIVEAKKFVGFEDLDLLSSPPDDLLIEVVIGHGAELGRHAQVIRNRHKCKWVQVVHTDSEELGMFNSYPDAISKGQEKHYIEVKLCEEADFVVTIGPKLAESFRRYLQSCKNHQTIFDFTPGIFEEFLSVDQGLEERKHCTVLVFGRGDAEDFQLKGFDIVGKAVASLADTHLIFVGAPDGKKQEMAQLLLKCDLPAHCLKVRGYVKCRESLRKLFCEVDLVVMPSRTDGFGLTGLEALSAGLPVLVSKNSGFGESLSKVPFGSSFVIDSEKPEVWAAAIKTIWDKERQSRLEEVQALRSSYERKYSWTKQSDALLVKIINLVRARLRLQIDCEAITRASAQTGMGTAVTPQQPQEVTQGAREVPSSSNKQHAVVTPTFAPEIELYGGIDTQTVMNIITLKTLQGLDVSIPEQRNQFVLYLERVHKALIVDAKSKCLLITVEVSSLQSLEDLWEDYSLGHVNKMAQKLLVTKELLEEFGLLEVKLTTFIAEEEYRACQEYFSVESSTWFTFETMAGRGRNGEELGRTRSSEPIPIPFDNFVAGEARLSIQETRNSAAEGNLSPPIQATDPVESSSWFTFETMAGTGRNEEELGRTRSSEPIPIPLDNLIDILRKLSELPQAFPHFVRRQKDELSNILTCLRPDNECQCVLLHGAPGIGKTTLAIKAANEILETNDRALVVYINCKYIYSFADFSEKVIRQIYPSRFPANNPEAEVKNRLITLNKTFFVLLLLDNFEFLLGNANDNEQENQRSAASLCPADSKDRRLIKDFIGEIAGWVRNVKLLVTSSNIVCFRQIGIKTMTLDPFSPEETFELLKNVHGDRVTVETSKELCEACNGIPLVLYTLMSSAINLPALVAYMNSSSPHDPAINKSLDYCFSRLRTQEQHTLLSLALVRGWFTLPKVAKAFCSATSSERDIKRHVVELGNCSLLQQNMFGETCRYTFLSNIRDYCIHKAASEEGFRVVFRRARNLLIDYLISFLKDTLKKFLSKDAVESAIDDFAYEKENVIQLVGWIDSGEVDAERVTKCIDAFNVAGELLAKMMAKSMFKGVYESLVRKCEEMGEQRRLGECLTSLGIKEIFNCTCTEGLCDKATARAQHYLEKANTIQSKLGMNHGNSRAQCLAKLGRCLAKSSDTRERGRGMIEDAIRIRQNAVKTPDEEEGGENVCHVMLGATFNDKAVALSLENRHRQAVTIREEKVLPIYIKRLGDHPFTATILNHLSNNHRDLKEIEAAERYVRKALEIRRKLLGDHRDTAKSLFDLGMVLKEKGEFQEAKTYLEKCKEMQEKVANDDPIFVQQTQQELEAVYLELGESPDPSPQGLFSSRKMTNPETCESQLPREASSEEATQLKRGAKRSEVESSTWFTFETMAGTGRNEEELGRTRSSEPIPIPLDDFVAGEARLSIQETRNSAAEGNLSPPIQATDPGSEGNLSPPIQATDPGSEGNLSPPIQATDPGISTPVPDFRSYVPSLLVVPDILRKLSELPKAFPHFVRRQKDELSNILTCLSADNECQCVLLHGAPGIGKTTLAIKAGNEILEVNDRALVVYINCKYVYSYADFSEKVIRQIYPSRFPANNPEAAVKNRLIALNKNFFILLLLDNFEFLLGNENDNEQENEGSAASLFPDSNDRRLIENSIVEIAKCVRNMKLLVTSSKIVCFPQIGPETVTLERFSPEETFKLLKNTRRDRITVETSKKLCDTCSGIPLVIYTLISWTRNLVDLVDYMGSSFPGKTMEILERIKVVPRNLKITECLDYCFSRLSTQQQHTLLSLALVRGWFTLPKVAKAFCSATSSERDITGHVLELANCSLLQHSMFGETWRYTLLSIIRDYCIHKAASEQGFRVVFRGARNLLMDHLISFLKDTSKKFLSKDAVESAIKGFAWEKENVLQLVEWIEKGEVDEERIRKCIDAFNVAGELLAKMMAKSMFKGVYESLVRKCEEMGEQRRLGECLTSLGIKEIFNCTCTEGLCDEATARAQPYLERANTIQTELGINCGNSRAQCLAKLGRCFAKGNDTRERGRGMIEDAILIRQNAVGTPDEEEGGENVCHVMLGATFNDKAVALSLENHHEQAVKIRRDDVLPIYRERLGDHPFTATILNNLSNNYRDLGEIEAAEQYVEEALKIRLKLLGVHKDTSKSLFDLGMVLKEKRKFQEAQTCLERCKEMQEEVADDDSIVQQTQRELEAVRQELGEL
ncbi:uncharacterized protein [Montipora foliosa]|uniref:uncharacterized protein isoform X4 n=1 Tax=Montipora foliosa TaxID=591990 RepID=UPI0035F14331